MTGEEVLNRPAEIELRSAKLSTAVGLAMSVASEIRRHTSHEVGTPDPSIESSLTYLMREPGYLTNNERIIRQELLNRAANVLGFELVPISEGGEV